MEKNYITAKDPFLYFLILQNYIIGSIIFIKAQYSMEGPVSFTRNYPTDMTKTYFIDNSRLLLMLNVLKPLWTLDSDLMLSMTFSASGADRSKQFE